MLAGAGRSEHQTDTDPETFIEPETDNEPETFRNLRQTRGAGHWPTEGLGQR